MNLLHIDSSILGEHSASRAMSAAIVARLAALHPGLTITHRDLGQAPIGHLTGAYLAAASGALTPDTALEADLAVGGAVMAEFLAADIVVIGVAMYNFTISSQLKSWIDRILVAGKTFAYTPEGPRGLAGGKRVILALARGGVYGADMPGAPFDFQEPYLRAVFGFIGLPSVEIIRAEGLATGPEQRQRALDEALAAATALQAA